MNELLLRRRVAKMEEPLPQGAVRIEYLQSSGTQYINTGVILQRADLCRLDMVFSASVRSIWNVNGLGGGAYKGPVVGINDRNRFGYAANTSDVDTGVGASLNVVYHFNLDIKNSTYIVKNYLTGNELYHNENISKSSENPGRNVSLVLFGYRSTGGRVTMRNMSMFKSSIYEDGVLLRDYIPVRIDTTGYMYDKVSKQLFGNAGTGSFILGPDK